MSRSIHETRRVYRGKSVSEIREMVSGNDPDSERLWTKTRLKREARWQRALQRLSERQNLDVPKSPEST